MQDYFWCTANLDNLRGGDKGDQRSEVDASIMGCLGGHMIRLA